MKNFPVLPVLVLLFSFRGFSQNRDSVQFKKIILTKDFISEGVATVDDVNRDGLIDVMAGSFWFEAPDWKRHEIAKGLDF